MMDRTWYTNVNTPINMLVSARILEGSKKSQCGSRREKTVD